MNKLPPKVFAFKSQRRGEVMFKMGCSDNIYTLIKNERFPRKTKNLCMESRS